MEFARLLEVVDDVPVVETSLLLAGTVDPANIRRQLSRWVAAGRLCQLRRGLYALAPPYQRTKPHPFIVANWVVRSSYVSLQAALAHYGLIPEAAPVGYQRHHGTARALGQASGRVRISPCQGGTVFQLPAR